MLTALILALFAVVLYVYALYPGVLVLVSMFRTADDRPPFPSRLPSVSLVVPAYNEASVIRSKVQNCLLLKYPPELLDVVIASDGSTDGTAAVARAAALPPLRVEAFPVRRGKTALLNGLIPTLTSEIVVQSDANSELDPEALVEIVRPFSDPSVGCVVGQLVFSNREDPRVASGEGLYWRYENLLKRAESRMGGTITANGGLYAFRTSLFAPLPEHIAGDAADPLRIASLGLRVVFEPRAIVREKAAENIREEFARKVRIMTQGLAAWVFMRGMLSPPRPWIAFQMLSHKLLRWFLPWLLLALLALCLLPVAPTWARALGAAQVLFYGVAVTGLLTGQRLRRVPLVGAAVYFCVANAAALIATLQYVTGRRYAIWEKSVSSR